MIAEAVEYLHSKNIVHRDIKPENILITSHYQEQLHIKLSDFGLATLTQDRNRLYRLKTIAGTPTYMAPEVPKADKSGPYTKKVDVWAIGCVAYVLLCGRLPFKASSIATLYRKIEKNDVELKPSRVWKRITNEGKSFVLQTLCVDADKRLTAVQCLEHPWLATPEDLRPTDSFSPLDGVADAISTVQYVVCVCVCVRARACVG